MGAGQRLEAGDQVPHVTVHALDGRRVSYAAMWQTQNLVLVALPSSHSISERALGQLRALDTSDTRCVITTDPLPGIAPPAVLIADKWGEIVHIVQAANELPTAEDLAEWIDYVRQRCPECEGEAR
jgi:peroxiredoxin